MRHTLTLLSVMLASMVLGGTARAAPPDASDELASAATSTEAVAPLAVDELGPRDVAEIGHADEPLAPDTERVSLPSERAVELDVPAPLSPANIGGTERDTGHTSSAEVERFAAAASRSSTSVVRTARILYRAGGSVRGNTWRG